MCKRVANTYNYIKGQSSVVTSQSLFHAGVLTLAVQTIVLQVVTPLHETDSS